MKSKKNHISVLSRKKKANAAFTLIELLVVIVIIGILAALVTGLAGGASRKNKVSRVQSDLSRLVTAIEDYKAALGSYPPDNVVIQNGIAQVRPAGLYYELLGTEYLDAQGVFVTLGGVHQITPAQAQSFFGRKGFQNSIPGEAQAFLTDIRSDQKSSLTSDPANPRNEVTVFSAPVDGPNSIAGANNVLVNTWKYVSSSPTNNTASFDLWAELQIGNETVIISNW
jgi:prepilin-type N-terminal cleavage/methylation domain-containing protein